MYLTVVTSKDHFFSSFLKNVCAAHGNDSGRKIHFREIHKLSVYLIGIHNLDLTVKPRAFSMETFHFDNSTLLQFVSTHTSPDLKLTNFRPNT